MSKNPKNLYFEPSKPTAFSNVRKLEAATLRGTKPPDIQAWLLKQENYTLHRPVCKHFQRNPYDVTNVTVVWECDLTDIQNLSRYNDKYRYLLYVIDVFSKFLHIVPLRSKAGTAVSTHFDLFFQNIHTDVRSWCG
jgi:hypothetical protein